MHPVHKYARDVLSGREIAGPYVRLACERHQRDMKRKDVVFSNERADHAIDFFATFLVHYTGQFAGEKFELHPSQLFIVGSAFGWVQKIRGIATEDCPRRYQRLYIEEGKGSGKTPLAAGMLLYASTADGEENAECYIAAADKNQANVCFHDTVAMLQESEALLKRAIVVGGEINPTKIQFPASRSYIKPVSKKIGLSGSGYKPHFVVADELHEHPSKAIIETLERGFKWRDEPMLVMITNSGLKEESAVCYEEHEYSRRILEGEFEDDRTFAYVCALDEGEKDELFAEKTTAARRKVIYKKANPLLDITVKTEYLETLVRQGKQLPSRQNRILRWHFCVWVDAESAWIKRDLWIETESAEIDWGLLEGKLLFLGLDLSSRDDLTAVAYVFQDGTTTIEIAIDGEVRELERPTYIGLVDCYTPADSIGERAKRDRAPYELWRDQGWLNALPGLKIRYEYVAADIRQRTAESAGVSKFAYDSYSFDSFKYHIEDAELPFWNIVQHPQGYARSRDTGLFMPESIDNFESLVLEGRIKVHANPVLRMAVSSATFEESPSGLRRFIKGKSNARIDALIALAMAAGTAEHYAATVNVWENDDFDLEAYQGQ